MAEVNSILDSTTRDVLPGMEVGITQLSVKFGKSVGDMTKGLYDIVSAAFDADDAIGLLETATKAAVAGITTTESAVKTLTGVLNAYGLSAAHAAEISDKLFQSVIRGVYTFSDLESALGYVTPIAANVGVSLDEVLSAMSAATRQGQHLDSVTRGLGLLLQGIVSPTNEAAEAAQKYGIDMSATALRVGGLEGFLKQLSEATAKYGQQILPELIGNMRSLRVALALTGETGFGGFTDDMKLMETSIGRTDDAMAAMMDTQQKMADIIEQSMEKVSRIVGEKLSGIDLWWKKSMVYWAAEFAEPFAGAGNKAVGEIDKAFNDIRQSYINNLINPAATGEKTILDKLKSGESVKKAIPLDVLLKYNVNTESFVGVQKINKEAQDAKKILESIQAGPEIIPESENLKKLNELLGGIGLADQIIEVGESSRQMGQIFTALDGVIENTNSSMETLFADLSAGRVTVDQVKSAFDDMKSAIEESNLSILMIKSEITELNEQLNTPFKGKESILEYEFAVKEATNQLERFQEYSNMATSQGPEFLNEFTNQFDRYGNSMDDVLRTIYDYNDAMKEQKKVTEEAEKANNDLAIAMAFNNLQMLKYQLIGMIRRRGNTRAEQRAMKQLQIENTKLRIEEMQNQYDADVANNDATNNEKETAYDEARAILENYIQFEQHQMWVLQDTRDEDLASMRKNINEQKELLERRTNDLRNENLNLINEYTLYGQSLRAIADDKELAAAFEKITGISAMKEAMALKPVFDAFISGKPILPTTSAIVPPMNSSGGANQAILNNVPNLASNFAAMLKKRIRSYDSGTDYVPSTGLYQLHKGEAVIPAGKNGGGSPIIININNPVVNNPNDVTKLANALENVVRSNLINKQTGKSKYRMA
jgi:TP901 family phage tail tape measure protein